MATSMLILVALAMARAANADACTGITDSSKLAQCVCGGLPNSAARDRCAKCLKVPGLATALDLSPKSPTNGERLCKACGRLANGATRDSCYKCIEDPKPFNNTRWLCMVCPEPTSASFGDARRAYNLTNGQMKKCFDCIHNPGSYSTTPYGWFSSTLPQVTQCSNVGGSKLEQVQDAHIKCVTGKTPDDQSACTKCMHADIVFGDVTDPADTSARLVFGTARDDRGKARCMECVAKLPSVPPAGNTYSSGENCILPALVDDVKLQDELFKCIESPATYNIYDEGFGHCPQCFTSAFYYLNTSRGDKGPVPNASDAEATKLKRRCMSCLITTGSKVGVHRGWCPACTYPIFANRTMYVWKNDAEREKCYQCAESSSNKGGIKVCRRWNITSNACVTVDCPPEPGAGARRRVALEDGEVAMPLLAHARAVQPRGAHSIRSLAEVGDVADVRASASAASRRRRRHRRST